ncbi:MAG: hypothetical protein ACRCS8_00765 [Brevinema sp.]
MKKTFLSLTLLTLVVACQKKSKEFPIDFNDPSLMEMSELPTTSIDDKSIQEILSHVDFKLGDQIKLDSPRRFIEISILFTLYQYSNYTQASKANVSEEEFDNILNKTRGEFYQKLGVSENEYIDYSINNGEKIQEFLSQNPDIANAYELSFNQVVD